jgi:segregation and condensation protein A
MLTPSEPDAAAPEPSPDSLLLRLEGFEGPLDLLLDLARGQKVEENRAGNALGEGQKLDLAKISILSVVDQFLAVIEGARQIRLELAADWLVMAAWLAWLKSRLLLPAGTGAAEEGELAAETLASRLRDLQAMRTAAAWLGARSQLGQDVFARGVPEDFSEIDRSRLIVDLPSLVRGYLTALRRAGANRVYRPRALTLWSVQDALGRLGKLVGSLPDWSTLESFLPENLADPMEKRAALASTLLAGLEMARGGEVRLRQEHDFGPILVQASLARQAGGDGDAA